MLIHDFLAELPGDWSDAEACREMGTVMEVVAALRSLRAQLNVENIFGTRYYPTADGNNNITPGSPRAARLSITASY